MISKLRERIGNVVKREEGFTLIELMIVIAVLGILAGIAIPKLSGVTGKAKDANITSAAGTIRNTMEMYRAEYGKYPSSATSYSDLNSDSNLGQYVKLPDLSEYASADITINTTSYSITFTSKNTNEIYTLSDGGVSW